LTKIRLKDVDIVIRRPTMQDCDLSLKALKVLREKE
jgi:hypothetical protein